MGARDRSIRFVFDTDAYPSGRPDMPLVSLEPGAELRSRAQGRVPRATFHAETFEEIDETDLVWVIAARAA